MEPQTEMGRGESSIVGSGLDQNISRVVSRYRLRTMESQTEMGSDEYICGILWFAENETRNMIIRNDQNFNQNSQKFRSATADITEFQIERILANPDPLLSAHFVDFKRESSVGRFWDKDINL